MLSAKLFFTCILISLLTVHSIDIYHISTIESSINNYGTSVEMNNNTLIVGTVGKYSNTGNYINVYQKQNKSWDFANNVQLEQNGWFGYSLAIYDEYYAVGAYAADKVFVYKNNNLFQTIKNTNSHEFGKSIALSEQYMIIGAPTGENSAYIYQLQDDKYTLMRSIIEYTSESLFGISVDITNEYAVIGSNNKVFLFINNNNDWDKLLEIDNYTNEQKFGYKVALSNDYLIVSAYSENKIFIFGKTNNTWNKEAITIIDQFINENEFGYSISVYNQMLLVGARGAKKAYLFENFIQNISNVVIVNNFEDQTGFGQDVALTDTHMAVTSNTLQKLYLFGFDYPSPTSNPTLSPTKNPTFSPTGSPTFSPTKNPTLSPSETPTLLPTENPTISPTSNSFENKNIAPTSSPTTQIKLILHADNHLTQQYMIIMSVSIASLSIIILFIIYIIHRCKKYSKVHIDDSFDNSTIFTSIYDMEKEGWTKTVHPVHLEYDSDEESQIIAPIHEKYKQKPIEPIV